MEGTPGLDIDSAITHPSTPTGSAMSYAPAASSSSMHHDHGCEPSSSSAGTAQPSSSHQKGSNGPHIRSRITVVCAECKRLKLKCDRRTPCSSCLKRDTVQRCVYSQAAAEKVDVQTLHNRIIEIERFIAQLQSTSPSTTVSAALAGLPSLRQPSVVSPSRAGARSAQSLVAGLPCNDRALLAQGSSGSSVVINMEDVVSLWLNELEEDFSEAKIARQDPHSSPMRPSTSGVSVKLEPTAVSIPPSASFSSQVIPPASSLRTLHPPAPYDVFLPPPSAGPSAVPQVTAALVAYLPAEPERSRYLKAFRETMLLHPCFNLPNFEQRIAAIFAWAEGGTVSLNTGPMSKAELARDIFFPSAKPNGSSKKDQSRGSGPPPGSGGASRHAPKPTLSFFAAASAAFALGALVARDEPPENSDPSPPAVPPSPTDSAGASATLFALSEQALQLSEKTAAYDPDSVISMILQVLFMLHEGQMSVAQNVFPLVGKMVNVARLMGLAIDPDEFPGTYNLFEAETRRRLWWDVFYYDLFVADCMGHPPLIADNTHTTRLPADVDEEKFTPSSTSLPIPEGADSDASSTYFSLKCRLAQLVKNVKKQTFKDPLNEGDADQSIDSASAFEGDVNVFLQELPAGFRLELAQDMSKALPAPTGSPFRLAQKCELAILAHRVVMKLYLPFLKDAVAANRPAHQAVLGTITAAHNIVYAARMLHSVWGRARPAVFDFYDFGRTLFDAAVVCAHAVIQEPSSILANEGMKSVVCALDVLKTLAPVRPGVEGARSDRSSSEAVRIVEALKRKAELARGGDSPAGGASAGTKRKHAEVEPEPLLASAGFQLPFVGASVSSAKPERHRATGTGSGAASSSSSRPAPAPPKEHAVNGAEGKSKAEGKKVAKDKDKEKSKDRSAQKVYDGPLRVRPMTGQPAPRRPRTASVSTTTGATPAPTSRAAPPPPSPLTTTAIQPTMVGGSSRASVSVPESPAVSTPFESYPPPPSAAPSSAVQESMQQQPQEDYNMQYSSGDDSIVDDRRYSVHSSYDSPQSAAMYEPQPQQQQPQQSRYAQPSSSAYPPPPPSGQQGYYMSYPSPAGPYDGTMPMNMGPPGPLDPAGPGGGIAPAMTTMPLVHEQHQQQHQQQQHYMPQQDRSHHPSYAHPSHPHPHSHPHMAEQGRHEYGPSQPPPPPGPHGHAPIHAPPHIQGWPHQGDPGGAAPGADMWNEYNKFYGGMAG